MKKLLIITLVAFLAVGCGQEQSPLSPADAGHRAAVSVGEKAGGGGGPVAPDCDYLISQEYVEELFGMAAAADNRNVTGFLKHGVSVPNHPDIEAFDVGFMFDWRQDDANLMKRYYINDWCFWGASHGHSPIDGNIESLTPEDILWNGHQVRLALRPDNRYEMIVDPYGQPGGPIHCYTTVDGGYTVVFNYVGKWGETRSFMMRLVVAEVVIPVDPPANG